MISQTQNEENNLHINNISEKSTEDGNNYLSINPLLNLLYLQNNTPRILHYLCDIDIT